MRAPCWPEKGLTGTELSTEVHELGQGQRLTTENRALKANTVCVTGIGLEPASKGEGAVLKSKAHKRADSPAFQ